MRRQDEQLLRAANLNIALIHGDVRFIHDNTSSRQAYPAPDTVLIARAFDVRCQKFRVSALV
jgi:hypothetical protein